MIKELQVNSGNRNELIDVTSQVAEVAKGVLDGVITLFVPHTTAAITINEGADPDVKTDILRKLSELIPKNDGYEHAEGNSDSHLKSSLFGPSLQVIVENGRLVLGTWQSIYFCEFDGPRNRKLIIKY
jgi:secondary thiamine-phosphate synthase enzyme